MPHGIPHQIATRPKKVAGDMSAPFGRSAGFRQHGSTNQPDSEPFDIRRLRNAANSRQPPDSDNGRSYCVFDPTGQMI
jgi:hypothetical protein